MAARGTAPLVIGLAFTLSGCGGLGLSYYDDLGELDEQYEDDAGEAFEGESPDQVGVEMTGRTYAVRLDEVEVVEPVGLQSMLAEITQDELLFHVVWEDGDELGMALTLADSVGDQDVCQPVFDLPRADWDNPDFSISDGTVDIELGGKPVELRKFDLDGRVYPDGSLWDYSRLRAEIDTRDLLGGSIADNVDVCLLVEELGGVCRECPDGVDACTNLELNLFAVEVDVAFDASEDGEGC